MTEGLWTEHQANSRMDHLRNTVLPAAEHRAMIEHELALMSGADRTPRPAPVRWIGERLIRLGERLRQGAVAPEPVRARR